MQFYLAALDDFVKIRGENPSIGIILCRDKNRTIVEYTLRDTRRPIGIATYKLTKRLPKKLEKELPSSEQISKLLKGEWQYFMLHGWHTRFYAAISINLLNIKTSARLPLPSLRVESIPSLWSILNNLMYGMFRFNGEIYEGTHEPIITEIISEKDFFGMVK